MIKYVRSVSNHGYHLNTANEHDANIKCSKCVMDAHNQRETYRNYYCCVAHMKQIDSMHNERDRTNIYNSKKQLCL